MSVSMQAIKLGERPERSLVSKEGTQSVWKQVVHDAMAGAQVPASRSSRSKSNMPVVMI